MGNNTKKMNIERNKIRGPSADVDLGGAVKTPSSLTNGLGFEPDWKWSPSSRDRRVLPLKGSNPNYSDSKMDATSRTRALKEKKYKWEE